MIGDHHEIIVKSTVALVTCGLLALEQPTPPDSKLPSGIYDKIGQKVKITTEHEKQRRTGNSSPWQRRQYSLPKELQLYGPGKEASGGWQVGLRVGFNHQITVWVSVIQLWEARLTWKRTSGVSAPKSPKKSQMRQAHYHAGRKDHQAGFERLPTCI